MSMVRTRLNTLHATGIWISSLSSHRSSRELDHTITPCSRNSHHCSIASHARARLAHQQTHLQSPHEQTTDVHNRIEQTSPGGAVCMPEQAAAGVCVGGWGRIGSAVGAARKAAADKGAGFLFLVS
jgi:hypothetical protein